MVEKDIATLKSWPRDFLPERLKREDINARIYTLGYNANSVNSASPNATIKTHAQNLLANLLADQSTASNHLSHPGLILTFSGTPKRNIFCVPQSRGIDSM